jgi:undecaprenyl diphosphate synthase
MESSRKKKRNSLRSDSEIPAHIAIVMDGNGRWALRRKRPRSMGHKAGLKSLRSIIEYCGKLGVRELTVFAFSSENWNRPEQEVNRLMDLFMRALDREAKELNENNVRIRFIGDIGAFSSALQKKIQRAQAQTARNTRMTFNVAVNYGGRWDIVQAARKLAEDCSSGLIKPEEINEELLSKTVSLSESRDPDLLIRTGGEMRISNFLLWQSAYTELHFTPTLWPDFGPECLDEAIAAYQSRERRFGLTSEQLRKSTRIFRQPASGPTA